MTVEHLIESIKKRGKAFAVVAVLIALAGLYFFGRSDDGTAGIDFIIAERGSVVSEVSVVGRVEPSERVDLAFEVVGRVASVAADVSGRVFAGMPLVRLENDNEEAALAAALARVKIEEAKLEELERGSTPGALAVKEVKVSNAEAALVEERRNLVAALSDAFTKSDDAVRNKVDQFFSGSETATPQITFTVIDPELKMVIESGRRDLSSLLNAWTIAANNLSLESDLSEALALGKGNLDRTKRFLDNVAIAVNAVKANANLSQTTIDAYRADVSTARTNVNTALSNVIAAEKKVRDAESALSLAQEELEEIKVGTRPEALAAQAAKVEEARATAREKEALLFKTILYSPIEGVVTRADAKVGEIIAANTTLVSVISSSDFEMKVNIPEADIAKVSVGDGARVTLDAYGSDVVFAAHVTSIEPAETIVEGVPTYVSTLHFNEQDERIRSGMTANVDILADRRDDVIATPARAVITRNGGKFVRVLNADNTVSEAPVEVGLRGSDGSIEIVKGVTEGERVIIFIEAERLESIKTRLHGVE